MTRTRTRRRRASDFRIEEGTKSFTPPRKRDYGFESSESDNGGEVWYVYYGLWTSHPF